MAEDIEVKSEAEAAEPALSDEEATESRGDEQVDEVQALKDDLGAAQERAAEFLDGWQRAQAEFSNYKKRQDATRSQMMLLANAGLVGKLLPVVDDFERAIATLPACLEQLTWVDGFLMIRQKLDAILQSEGVQAMETEGKSFDPKFHEAITYEVAQGYEEGQIIGDVQRGYTLGDRVLRPALVRVAKAPQAPVVADTAGDEIAEDNADG